MQENRDKEKNEASWNFRCGQGKIPPQPPDTVMLGTIPVPTEHLQCLAWSKERAQQLSCHLINSLRADFSLKMDKRDILCTYLSVIMESSLP